MQKTPVLFMGWEDPLEKGKATHSSILAFQCYFPNLSHLSFPHCVQSLFTMSASPLLPCMWVHQYHKEGFSINYFIWNTFWFCFKDIEKWKKKSTIYFLFWEREGHLDKSQQTVKAVVLGYKPAWRARVWTEPHQLSTPDLGSFQASLCLGQYLLDLGIVNWQGGKQGKVFWR